MASSSMESSNGTKSGTDGTTSSSSNHGDSNEIPWSIKKRLIGDDRVELGMEEKTLHVKDHILCHLTDTPLEKGDRIKITVRDFDDEHWAQLTLKRHKMETVPGEAYALTDGWREHFVLQRGLDEGDEIKLYWDENKKMLLFSAEMRTSRFRPFPVGIIEQTIVKELPSHKKLLLSRKETYELIVPHLDECSISRVESGQEILIPVLDCYEDRLIELMLSFDKTVPNLFELTNGWEQHFVNSGNLQEGDEFRLFWENQKKMLLFSVVWPIKEKVTNFSKLALSKEDVSKYILLHLSQDLSVKVMEGDEIQIDVLDFDKKLAGPFILTLRLNPRKMKYFEITTGWRKHFVERRNLQKNDSIGLSWDIDFKSFLFHVISRI